MRKLLTAGICCCAAAHAAVIGGVVLDRVSGRPLARSLVMLRPVDGVGGRAQSVRANRTGQFTFVVSGGMYLLRASRAGFAPFEYGQRDWKSAGKPMAVEQDGSLYLDIRLRRFGAIAGTVLDENEIGIPDQKVIAYTAAQPLKIAASATTDDRGVYRIHGLEPGTFYVRAGAKQLEDGSGLLPTFHKETMAVDQSLTVDVDLDQQAEEIDIQPLPGKLFRFYGKVRVAPRIPVTLSLISDVGRVEMKTADKFAFEQIPPGTYQLIAEADDPYGRGTLSAYQEVSIDHDTEQDVPVMSSRETEFRMQDEKGNSLPVANARITARRKDLDGSGHAEVLKVVDGRAALGLGRWEFSVAPPGGFYPIEVSGSYGRVETPVGRADGWNEVYLRGTDTVTIKLSPRPATVHGVLNGPGHEPAPGAPVYLEGFDKDSRRRVGELRTVRTDIHGRYRFTGLAPGLYRIAGTFEYAKPDSDAMETAGARALNLSESDDISQDLDLYAP